MGHVFQDMREYLAIDTARTFKSTAGTQAAVPAEILDEVDRAARARGESRSRFVNRVLSLAVRARRDAEVTRRLNMLFADASRSEAQRRAAEELSSLGVDWSDERW